MSNLNPEQKYQSVILVVLGKFNPSIFQPMWFKFNELLSDEDVKYANDKLQIIHPEISQVETEWFSLQVTKTSLTIEIKEIHRLISAKDLALGIFTVLEHTPVEAFGLNLHTHYGFTSDLDRDRVLDAYAPRNAWSNFLQEPALGVCLMSGTIHNSEASKVGIKLQPSSHTEAEHGIHVAINQHFDIDVESKNDPELNMTTFLKALSESWDELIPSCENILQELFKTSTTE